MRVILALFFMSIYALSWEGYSYEKGNYIEIESYDHQAIGEGPVEYYDYSDGEYKSGYLDMYPGGSGTITDDESGESFEVEMEQ
ncbi:MAG TPA: hypothetical protein CFH82_07395 [Sulfurospirillum sp. UBA12182]|nr:MAG TPA: hypothetical protein CFH82_07395 [Sulfurospirillum sp. UBA12182]